MSAKHFCQFRILLWSPQTMHEIIVSAPWHLKESAHYGYCILISVSENHLILDPGPHILSTHCRKSRSNSFSIFRRLFSYLYSASVLAGLRPRCFGIMDSFNQLWIAHRLIPYSLLIAFWLSPARILDTTVSRIPWGYCLLSIVRFYWSCSLPRPAFIFAL